MIEVIENPENLTTISNYLHTASARCVRGAKITGRRRAKRKNVFGTQILHCLYTMCRVDRRDRTGFSLITLEGNFMAIIRRWRALMSYLKTVTV